MKFREQMEYVQNMPKFNLIWTILAKSQIVPNYDDVDKTDVFTILAAILDCQVGDMVNVFES